MAKKKKRVVRTKAQRIADYQAKIVKLQSVEDIDEAKEAIRIGRIAGKEAAELRKLIRHYTSMVKAIKTFKHYDLQTECAAADALRVAVLADIRRIAKIEEPPNTAVVKRKRPSGSKSRELIKTLETLWAAYLERPIFLAGSKRRLRAVLKHMEEMKGSSNVQVREARAKVVRKAFSDARKSDLMI